MNSSKFFSLIISIFFIATPKLLALSRNRPLTSRLQTVSNFRRQQLAQRTALRARIKPVHTTHKRSMHGIIIADYGTGLIAAAKTVGKFIAVTGGALGAIIWDDGEDDQLTQGQQQVVSPARGVFRVKYDEKAAKAVKEAAARGETIPATSFAYNTETGLLSLLPDPPVEITAERDLIAHPHGIHKFFRRTAQNADKFPKDPQRVLDEAVLDPASKKLWGVEDGKLVMFTEFKDGTGKYLEAHFYAFLNPRALLLAQQKQEELRSQKSVEKKISQSEPEVHPYGIHKFVRKNAHNADKFPKDPQTVLDEAVWDTKSKKLWGVEDGKLVYFTPIKDGSGATYYEGSFWPKPQTYAYALQLALQKQQEVRAHKAQRTKAREQQESIARYKAIMENALPKKAAEKTQALITGIPPVVPSQDARHPHGIFQSTDAYSSQQGQKILDEAAWEDGLGTYINVDSSENIVRFTPIPNTNRYAGFVLLKGTIPSTGITAELCLVWNKDIKARVEARRNRIALPEGLFDNPGDIWTPEQKAAIKKAYADLRIVYIERGRLGDLFTSPYVCESFRNLGLAEKNLLNDFFRKYQNPTTQPTPPVQTVQPAANHLYGLYGASVEGLQEPQNKQKTLDEAVMCEDRQLRGREGEVLFLFMPRSHYVGGDDHSYVGVRINNPAPALVSEVTKKQAARAQAPVPPAPQPPTQEELKPLYAGEREYKEFEEEQSFPGRALDPALQKAIAQTHQDRGAKVTASYALEQKTLAALEALNFDTKTEFEAQYTGDHVQHHVHQMFIASLNKIGSISRADPEVQRLLRGAVVLNKNGQAYNNHHLIKQALSAHHACDMVIDYAKTVADLSLAAGEGVLEGIRATGTFGKGVLDAVTFPEEYRPVVQEAFHKATLALSRFVAIIREDMALIARGDGAALNEFMHRREARGKEFDAFLQVLIKKYDDLTLRDKVKAVAQLFTECKSMGTLAELFAESVQLKRIAATGAVVEDILLCPRHALAEEVVHVATHVIDVEPITINAVLEVAQRDVGLVERIKKSQEAVSRQITAYFDQSLDFYRTSPGYIGIDKQPRVTQIAGLSLQAARELRLVEYLDPSVGDIKKLQEALKLFSDNKSAIVPGGPLATLLDCGKKKSAAAELNTARGSAFELERGYDLAVKGEKTIIFAGKYPRITTDGRVTGVFDVDIETASKFIECKNCDWKYVSDDRIRAMKSKLPQLAEIALSKNKTFELHSKYPIPNDLKEWLKNKNIPFIEG